MTTRCFLTVLLSVLLAGCGGAGSGFKGPTGQVSGKITYSGQPIPVGSQVVFQAKTGPGYMATGTVKANGEYNLLHNGQPDVPGVTYLVQISPPGLVTSAPAQMTTEQMSAIGTTPKAVASEPPFPARYAATSTSNLESLVKAGKNTADFELTK